MTDYSIVKKLFGLTAAQGFSEDEIEQMRSVFGVLPEALETWYRELGKAEGANHVQNDLYTPDCLPHLRTDSYLLIYIENQGVSDWGIRKEDLTEDDPPVYVANRILLWGEDKKARKEADGRLMCRWPEWKLEADHVSEFLIGMAYFNAGFYLPCSNGEIYTADEPAAMKIRSLFQQVCPATKSWIDGGSEFFGLHNQDALVLLRNGDGYDVHFAAADENVLAEMNGLLQPLLKAY